LISYGFCLKENKYNSVPFRVWIPKPKPETPMILQANVDIHEENKEDDLKIVKDIKLKLTKFPYGMKSEILEYCRINDVFTSNFFAWIQWKKCFKINNQRAS
jgi:hypothetical protein